MAYIISVIPGDSDTTRRPSGALWREHPEAITKADRKINIRIKKAGLCGPAYQTENNPRLPRGKFYIPQAFGLYRCGAAAGTIGSFPAKHRTVAEIQSSCQARGSN